MRCSYKNWEVLPELAQNLTIILGGNSDEKRSRKGVSEVCLEGCSRDRTQDSQTKCHNLYLR